MPLNSSQRQLIIGLPETGKSTYLAALWYLVRDDTVPTMLKARGMPAQSGYLNEICAQWLSLRPLERTKLAAEPMVSMVLADPETTEETEVLFPDVSGEWFKIQWKDRKCTLKYYEYAAECSRVLLFLHPERIDEGYTIDEVAPAVAELESSEQAVVQGGLHKVEAPTAEQPTSPVAAKSEYDPDKDSPTQVKMVELIQFLLRPPFEPKQLKIAVIVSAWDMIVEQNLSPGEWFKRRLPLLSQFLRANHENITYRIYGVSAQGGPLPVSTPDLLRKNNPSERIIVKDTQAESNDLTAPIKWLMD
jgi:hypothetical protein